MKRLASSLAALLGLGLVVPAVAQNPPVGPPLVTRWARDVSSAAPLPEYPRPQLTRAAWRSLNGPWDYALTGRTAAMAPDRFDGKILVPYPIESTLSGVRKTVTGDQRLWYRRTFTIPAAWTGQHVLLHFGAVDHETAVTLNGHSVGTHVGGYDAFDYDITGELKPGANELVVAVHDATSESQPIGKQRAKPGGIFYTACTGIWQTVWLEPVPAAHITGVKITPDIDTQKLRLTVQTVGSSNARVQVTARDGGRPVATVTGASDTEIALPVRRPHLWTPDDPHLYDLKVVLLDRGKPADSVGSYFAMRKISLGKDAHGITRLMLNNRFVFQRGVLDQGYWPDGIYTAPTDAALRYDIETTKKLGFNMCRKHAKVEPDRWYYWTDKLGELVWQDMPQAFSGSLTDAEKRQWMTDWKNEIATHSNHPSIVVWTTFNEGWGQHDTEDIVALTRKLDPSRLVDNASGWNDRHVGDINDTHAYPVPNCSAPEANRAVVCGEFGGVTMRVPGHMWTTDVFGYGSTLKDGRLVTRRYQDLLKTAYGLRDTKGMSAFVYTQITDVEQESNGILTYDRAVIKPDAAIVTAANEGRFLPLPPNPHPDLVQNAQDRPSDWHYTTNTPPVGWYQPTFDDSSWKSGQSGFGHEVGEIHTPWTTSDIWLRRTVTLPAALPATLAFTAFHDEDCEIYVNGVLAGSATGYSTDYVTLPMTDAGRAALKPGSNILAVHCHQTIGGQFIDVGITAP